MYVSDLCCSRADSESGGGRSGGHEPPSGLPSLCCCCCVVCSVSATLTRVCMHNESHNACSGVQEAPHRNDVPVNRGRRHVDGRLVAPKASFLTCPSSSKETEATESGDALPRPSGQGMLLLLLLVKRGHAESHKACLGRTDCFGRCGCSCCFCCCGSCSATGAWKTAPGKTCDFFAAAIGAVAATSSSTSST